MKPRLRLTRLSKRFENYVLLLTVVVFLLLMLGFPTISNIIYSFSQVKFENLRSPELKGFNNYIEVWKDAQFWKSLSFSLRFGVGTALVEVFMGFLLAIYLAPILRKRRWLLAILMLPMMVAPAMMGLMYRLMLHEFVGMIPFYWTSWLGEAPSFLSPDTVFWTVFTIEVLQWTPFALLLGFMAYESIPQELREAAAVDGSGTLRMFWAIEIPLMLPTLGLAFIIRFIDGFRVFDNIYVLVGSGAGGQTMSLSIYIYETFFRRAEIGHATAASLLLFIAAFVVLYVVGRLQRKRFST